MLYDRLIDVYYVYTFIPCVPYYVTVTMLLLLNNGVG